MYIKTYKSKHDIDTNFKVYRLKCNHIEQADIRVKSFTDLLKVSEFLHYNS